MDFLGMPGGGGAGCLALDELQESECLLRGACCSLCHSQQGMLLGSFQHSESLQSCSSWMEGCLCQGNQGRIETVFTENLL